MSLLRNLTHSKTKTYLIFFPFFLLYVVIVISFSNPEYFGDEARYVQFAQNLLKGYYSPPPPNINLWNGPGYPMLILPFVWAQSPLLLIKMLNALLLFATLLIFYNILTLYDVTTHIKHLSTAFLGFYFPYYQHLIFINTEIFSVFLVTLFAYFYLKYFQSFKRKYLLIAAVILAYTALTKVIFGYVILAWFILSLIKLISQRKQIFGASISICVISLLLCSPYLYYTYSLTGKFFYWGSAGGLSLYTMSNPYPNEYGDWFQPQDMQKEFLKNHKPFFDSMAKLNQIERDDALKKMAIRNIKNNPSKFVKNWISNISRILFSFPFSYAHQTPKTLFTVIPNMFIVVGTVLFFFLTLFFLKQKIPFEIISLLLFIGIYFLGSSFLSAFRRMIFVMVPILLIWFSYIVSNFICIRKDQVC